MMAKGCQDLGYCLSDSSIKHLDISNNNVEADGLSSLTHSLRLSTTITTLNLSGNDLRTKQPKKY